jgi:hypothetical protein
MFSVRVFREGRSRPRSRFTAQRRPRSVDEFRERVLEVGCFKADNDVGYVNASGTITKVETTRDLQRMVKHGLVLQSKGQPLDVHVIRRQWTEEVRACGGRGGYE